MSIFVAVLPPYARKAYGYIFLEATNLSLLYEVLRILKKFLVRAKFLHHARVTKVSITFFSPALSKSTVSLLPSTKVTRP